MKERNNVEALKYLFDLESVQASIELSRIYNSTRLWARLQESRPDSFLFKTFGVEYKCKKIIDNKKLSDHFEKFEGEDGLVEARYAISPNIIKTHQIGMLVTPPERSFDKLQASIKSITKKVPDRALTLTGEEIDIFGLIKLNTVEEVITDPMSISIGKFHEEMLGQWMDRSNRYSAYYVLERIETVDTPKGNYVLKPESALTFT